MVEGTSYPDEIAGSPCDAGAQQTEKRLHAMMHRAVAQLRAHWPSTCCEFTWVSFRYIARLEWLSAMDGPSVVVCNAVTGEVYFQSEPAHPYEIRPIDLTAAICAEKAAASKAALKTRSIGADGGLS